MALQWLLAYLLHVVSCVAEHVARDNYGLNVAFVMHRRAVNDVLWRGDGLTGSGRCSTVTVREEAE